VLKTIGMSVVKMWKLPLFYSSFDVKRSMCFDLGQVALRSSFTYTQFDNLVIDSDAEANSYPNSLFDKHLLWPPKAAPGGPQDPALPLTAAKPSLFGCAFTAAKALTVEALARFGAGFVASEEHTISIIDAATKKTLGSAQVDLTRGQASVAPNSTHGGDLNGYVWAELEKPLTLAAGKTYYLVSSEGGADTYYDSKVWLQPHPGLLEGLVVPAFKDTGGDWHVGGAGASAAPIAAKDLHYIISKSTKECWDTRSHTILDLWDCVPDGHNELFNYR
jgi:hypothetical protein